MNNAYDLSDEQLKALGVIATSCSALEHMLVLINKDICSIKLTEYISKNKGKNGIFFKKASLLISDAKNGLLENVRPEARRIISILDQLNDDVFNKRNHYIHGIWDENSDGNVCVTTNNSSEYFDQNVLKSYIDKARQHFDELNRLRNILWPKTLGVVTTAVSARNPEGVTLPIVIYSKKAN